MTDQLISQLVDFGALGLFSGFLVYQFIQMQKRLDNLVERFQEQVNAIGEDFDKRVEDMRTRYDVVITDIRRDCRENEARLQNEVKEAQRELLARERQSLANFKIGE
tara:strand:- start:26067 stop:26387 length:321 start_codon:yes stop_codon:yes gene_type:complete